jgi:hypothetical protein
MAQVAIAKGNASGLIQIPTPPSRPERRALEWKTAAFSKRGLSVDVGVLDEGNGRRIANMAIAMAGSRTW